MQLRTGRTAAKPKQVMAQPMFVLLFKATGIWFILVIIAILNAVVRDKILEPLIGRTALPVSGLLLSLFIFIAAFVSVPLMGSSNSKDYGIVGIAWFGLTLGFELLFGRFVTGKSWQAIMGVFNILKGDLFSIALLTCLVSPWVSAKLRNLI